MALAQHQARDRRRALAREQSPGATGPGAVGSLLDDGPLARVLLDGETYGPVPVAPFPTVLAEPGARVFLHLDMRGQPIYAQLLP